MSQVSSLCSTTESHPVWNDVMDLERYLPPVGIFLVEDLKDVSAAEFQSGFFTGDEIVMSGIVVKVTLYKGLDRKKNENDENNMNIAE